MLNEPSPNSEDDKKPRDAEVAKRAFQLWEKHGKVPGHEARDWFEAEANSIEANGCDELPADDLQKKCDEEFTRYEVERAAVVKSEQEAEKNDDTALLTISTLAIGASFTVFKDVVRANSATCLIIMSWVSFSVCLFTALLDRLWSYDTHQKWRNVLDVEFSNWEANGGAGAWGRVLPKYDEIRFVKILPRLKYVGLWSLFVGLVFLMLFAIFATPSPQSNPIGTSSPSSPNVVVNQYSGTQPSQR
jgi:hypothetical protein